MIDSKNVSLFEERFACTLPLLTILIRLAPIRLPDVGVTRWPRLYFFSTIGRQLIGAGCQLNVWTHEPFSCSQSSQVYLQSLETNIDRKSIRLYLNYEWRRFLSLNYDHPRGEVTL